MTHYHTQDGDVLDAICWKYYGRQAGAVEAVLEANMHLAAIGEVLPAGLVIVLPELEAPALPTTVRLWD